MSRRIFALLAVCAIIALGVYWVGSDVLGLWFPLQLPWQVYQQEYAPPQMTLAGASEEQVIRSIFSAWLDSYKSAQTEPMARLRDYSMDQIDEFQSTAHGFVCRVEFSVRPYGRPPKAVSLETTLAQMKTYWISGNGELLDGWLRHKVYYVWVRRDGDVYSVENLGTAPPELDGAGV